ncbi:hypothetical protein ANN_24963 [Periplaneta americana]|uniref:Uncharacterized protein n=1 Tax=Periplaneta americana TaxID=6978 RepID=A0ABQ8S044_PERAM|nr:hypothetical protein ANN_24963 [Periplaneta americana]
MWVSGVSSAHASCADIKGKVETLSGGVPGKGLKTHEIISELEATDTRSLSGEIDVYIAPPVHGESDGDSGDEECYNPDCLTRTLLEAEAQVQHVAMLDTCWRLVSHVADALSPKTRLLKAVPNLHARLNFMTNDMVLGSTNKEQLQKAVNNLEMWAERNDFTINQSKTLQIVFRKGGRTAADDAIRLKDKPLQITNTLTLQTSAASCKIHTRERATAAKEAFLT